MENRVGQQLGNYRFIRLLGQGGFAETYLVEHISLKQRAAMKVFRTPLSQEDQEQFLSEVQTIAGLKHPHIASVLEWGVQEGIPFLVMPYVVGGTLRQRHPRGSSLTPITILPYIQQIASSLDAAHSQGILHRSLKPENMLLDLNSIVSLSDFGLAIGQQSSRTQSMAEAAGAAVYMAPELLQGRPQPASDQYALGIVVYEWLCGAVPFEGSFAEVVGKHLSASPPVMKPPAISPAVETVVMRALAKAPEQRFASVQAFMQAFEQEMFLDEETIRAHPSSRAITVFGASQDAQATRAAPFHKAPASPLSSPQPAIAALHLETQPVIRRTRPRRRSLAQSRVTILIAAVLLAILGGIGIASFGTEWHRAQVNIQTTATALARVQATTRAQQNLYKQATAGLLILDDSLSENNDPVAWIGECTFANGSLQVSSAFNVYPPIPCLAQENQMNFAYQVQMTILKGDEGGLIFRANTVEGAYQFLVNQDGSYQLNGPFLTGDKNHPLYLKDLLSGSSSAIRTGLGESNLLTVLANGENISLYINQQYVGRVVDNGDPISGYLGVLAWATPDLTEVVFSNAKVWLL